MGLVDGVGVRDEYAVVGHEHRGVGPAAVVIDAADVLGIAFGSRDTRLEVVFLWPQGPDRSRFHTGLLVQRFDVLEELPDAPAVAADGGGDPRSVVSPLHLVLGFLVPDH
jgi:hypothetical protein